MNLRHARLGDTQNLANLFQVQLLAVIQGQHQLLLFGQRGDGGKHVLACLPLLEHIEWIGVIQESLGLMAQGVSWDEVDWSAAVGGDVCLVYYQASVHDALMHDGKIEQIVSEAHGCAGTQLVLAACGPPDAGLSQQAMAAMLARCAQVHARQVAILAPEPGDLIESLTKVLALAERQVGGRATSPELTFLTESTVGIEQSYAGLQERHL